MDVNLGRLTTTPASVRHSLCLISACSCCCRRGHLQLPEGDWFCSGQCTTIKAQLGALVRAGEMTLGGTKEHSWHVLRGFKHSAGRVSGAAAGMHGCSSFFLVGPACSWHVLRGFKHSAGRVSWGVLCWGCRGVLALQRMPLHCGELVSAASAPVGMIFWHA
jgi:hypothetical protein